MPLSLRRKSVFGCSRLCLLLNPDGNNFFVKLIDKREVLFRDRRTEILFPGSGQSLHNNKDVEKNQDCKTKIHSLQSVKETGMIPSFLYYALVLCWCYVLR